MGLSACSALPEHPPPTEYLDEQTAATVTFVDKPMVFARSRTELAANARDYVTLAATSVNRSGKVQYLLLAYFWSTIEVPGEAGSAAAATLTLAADDRRISLALDPRSAREAGVSTAVHSPAGPARLPRVYRTDLDTLRFIAAVRRLEVRAGTDEAALAFEIWDDGRASLDSFVRFVTGQR